MIRPLRPIALAAVAEDPKHHRISGAASPKSRGCRDAHRLTHLARAHGRDAELHERFLRAQLIEGEVLDDADTLVRLSAEVGVPKDGARR